MEQLLHGDCLELLRSIPDNSVDAVVTDPPYGLEFMGKEWDRLGDVKHANRGTQPNRKRPPGESGTSQKFRLPSPAFDLSAEAARAMQDWHLAWATEVLRVLKPGAHLLAFGGTRTYHRLACAVEDAGFEIRDMIEWLYGSGFPKSLDVSKAMDKAAGAERGIIADGERSATRPLVADQSQGRAYRLGPSASQTAPATDLARQWHGWGTALKPAHEPIVVARKPLIGTVAQNVDRYGTGALNVDGCRIHSEDAQGHEYRVRRLAPGATVNRTGQWKQDAEYIGHTQDGRWPANVCLDEGAAAMLDEQSGDRPSGSVHVLRRGGTTGKGMGYGSSAAGNFLDATYGDSGGASRFFYTAKASKADRGENNTHPTVKPVDLMRWLVRLVTPPGGIILDPFAGSGSTLVAARSEGFGFIGIEREQEYVEIARRRLEAAAPPLFAS